MLQNGKTEHNRTLSILRQAEDQGYGVIAQIVYDGGQALAFVRALEAKRSPGILQLFPVTVKQLGGSFLAYCLNMQVHACELANASAHSASVPISVHLDHATDDESLQFVLDLAEKGIKFDSIMVDASHADTDEENIAIAVPYIERCNKLGIATEVELGRLEGGEAGLREITGAMLTDPTKAEAFMHATGADILAPSVGNLHGSYKFVAGGPNFRQEILQDLQRRFAGRKPFLCLHGTDELPDELFHECIRNGVSKVNVNSWLRDPYVEALANGLKTKTMPEAIDDALAAFQMAAEKFCDLLDSSGKA